MFATRDDEPLSKRGSRIISFLSGLMLRGLVVWMTIAKAKGEKQI